MKSRQIKNKKDNQRVRVLRKRVISILTAGIVLASTYGMGFSVAASDEGSVPQEPPVVEDVQSVEEAAPVLEAVSVTEEASAAETTSEEVKPTEEQTETVVIEEEGVPLAEPSQDADVQTDAGSETSTDTSGDSLVDPSMNTSSEPTGDVESSVSEETASDSQNDAETGDGEETDTEKEDEEEDEEEVKYPPQRFEKKLDGNKLIVVAEAEEGTFPEGTTMEAAMVGDKAILDKIIDVVEDEETTVISVKAVDITFKDKDGKEIEPKKAIKVTITSDEIAKAEDNTIVHVDDNGQTQIVNAEDPNANHLQENEILFKGDQFSIYAVVSSRAAEEGSVSDEISDADSEAQEFAGEGLTVSVEETGNLKKLSGYHVVVEDADDEYSDADVLKAYHIYLANEEGTEVSASELENGKLNLKVNMMYDVLPDWFEEAETVKHYKNGAEQSISAVKVDADNKEISFIVHGFSEFTINSGSSITTRGGQNMTTQQGSILDGMTFDDADEWQIVSEEYTDNAAGNKTPSSEGRIRVQKNVLPTAVENEFDVYLSVDTSSLYEHYFELATYSAVTQNASHDMTLGVFYDDIVISSSVFVSPTNYSNGPFYVTIKAPDGTILIQNLKLYWNKSNNFTVYIATSSGYIVIANSVKAGNSYTVTLSQASYDAMQKDIVNNAPQLTSVVDTLGEYIVYDGIVGVDGTVSANNGVLTWTPRPKDYPNQTITEWTDLNGHIHKVTWNNNVAELVYKCHLDVTKDGFVSGQTYDVNENAVLTYTGDVSGTVNFPIPQVKGTTYGFELKKINESGEPLAGAEFTLTGPSNNPDVSSSTFTATSDANGLVSFTGMPIAWGQYSLAETTPPVGYGISEDSPWTLNIGYTTDLADETIDEHTGDTTTPSVFPGIWIGQGLDWKITNKKNVITVTKFIDTFGELDKTHINHTIYVVLWDRTDHKYVKDSNGNYVYGTIDIVNGVPSTTLTFDQYLESHSYSVWELLEQPTADMSESDIEAITINPGTVVGTDSTGQKIELREISTTYADLTNSNTASARINNKYEHQNETRKFTVNKQWISNSGNAIEPPAGETVEFTLYRSENGGEPQRVTSITLDGSEAVPWVATFQDLPTMDVDTGYSYTYMVKETSHPDGYLPYLSASASASPMGENDYQRTDGGSIYNKKQSTDITVKKIVEGLASDSDIDFEFTATLPEGTTFPAQADGVQTDGNTASFTLRDTETITLRDIPVDVVLSITESNDGTFTTTAEGRTGGTFNNYTYTFTVVDEDGVVTFTNVRATQQVRIFKTGDDLNGAALGGATFSLSGETVDLSGLVSIEAGTNAGYLPTETGGNNTVFTLHVGDYSLQETAPPANYNMSEAVAINVTDQGVTYTIGEGDPITAQVLNDAYTVVVTDIRKRESITITKVLEDEYSDAAEKFLFHTTLMDKYTDITDSISGLSNFTLIPGNETNKSITFEGIPVGAVLHITETSTGEGELNIDNYDTSAEATGVTLSGGVDSRDYSFTVSDVEEDISVTFTNTRKKMDVNIQKVDPKNNPLPGASFKLTQVDENGQAVTGGITKNSTAVDANGKLTFTDLVAGYYEFEETEYPDGYINSITENPIFQIVLDENGNLTVQFEDTETVTYDAETNTFTVINTPGEELPSSGGSGTLPFTLGGIGLILASALIYIFKLRRRERRRR